MAGELTEGCTVTVNAQNGELTYAIERTAGPEQILKRKQYVRGGKSVCVNKHHTAVRTYIRKVFYAPYTLLSTRSSRPKWFIRTVQSKRFRIPFRLYSSYDIEY